MLLGATCPRPAARTRKPVVGRPGLTHCSVLLTFFLRSFSLTLVSHSTVGFVVLSRGDATVSLLLVYSGGISGNTRKICRRNDRAGRDAATHAIASESAECCCVFTLCFCFATRFEMPRLLEREQVHAKT